MSALTLFSLAALVAAPSAPARAPSSAEAVGSTRTLVSAYMHKVERESSLNVVAPSVPIPSFSRQTGLACSACHTSFPQLNAFGRMFKLNGYTMTTGQTVQAQDSSGKSTLRLDRIPPLSAMAITSLTSVRRNVPDQQNTSVEFPQELGLFYGGAIAPKIGAFLQLTYDPADGTIGMDNADIRFANHTTVGGKDVLYGVDINNSPTVQDVWNSTPVWGYPFVGSEVAPGPMASTLIDENLGQTVMGAGAYALWNNLVYGEVSVYRSAFQGGPIPVDGSAENAIHGVAPYWRVAVQHELEGGQIMVGTYGMIAHLVPSGFEGTWDTYKDAALDAQYDKTTQSGASLVAHATWIHESRALDATFAAGAATNLTSNLSTSRIDAIYYFPSRLGLGAGFFSTQGDSDPLLYPADPVDGSANGSPNSQGYILQASFMPWLNTRVGVQYVGYTSFNGSRFNYDGAGRDASDNNTLYLMTWLVF
jgi:hypothetical protein